MPQGIEGLLASTPRKPESAGDAQPETQQAADGPGGGETQRDRHLLGIHGRRIRKMPALRLRDVAPKSGDESNQTYRIRAKQEQCGNQNRTKQQLEAEGFIWRGR